jgi:hypothetical protein
MCPLFEGLMHFLLTSFPISFHMFPLWAFLSFESTSSSIWRFQLPHQKRVINATMDNVKLGFTIQIPLTQAGHSSLVYA